MKIFDFKGKLHQEDRAHFQALIEEGKLVARVDAADIMFRGIATGVIMRHESWLHIVGFPRKAQHTIEDLPFDGSNLFNKKTDVSRLIEGL